MVSFRKCLEDLLNNFLSLAARDDLSRCHESINQDKSPVLVKIKKHAAVTSFSNVYVRFR